MGGAAKRPAQQQIGFNAATVAKRRRSSSPTAAVLAAEEGRVAEACFTSAAPSASTSSGGGANASGVMPEGAPSKCQAPAGPALSASIEARLPGVPAGMDMQLQLGPQGGAASEQPSPMLALQQTWSIQTTSSLIRMRLYIPGSLAAAGDIEQAGMLPRACSYLFPTMACRSILTCASSLALQGIWLALSSLQPMCHSPLWMASTPTASGQRTAPRSMDAAGACCRWATAAGLNASTCGLVIQCMW